MAKNSKYIKDLEKKTLEYLQAIMNIEDNSKVSKHTREEARRIIEETKVHEQIVLESLQV
jgi:hypothetical protein